MRNKCNRGSVVICAMAVMLGFAAQARTFDFKQLKSTGTTGSAEYWWEGTEKSKSSWFQVKIGGATKIDDMSEMEIRAATVLKSVKDKKTGINDIATFEFDPINKGKAIFFMISTGSAFSRERESYYYGNVNTGWQLAGIIIEIWQKGKVVKHWSNMSGKDGKVKLTENIKKLRINRDGHPSEGERYYSAKDFDNATEIYSVDQKGERIDLDEVLKPFRESEEGNKASSKGDDASVAQPSAKNTVAPKLRTCEFLLNKKFKKNAKFYLCLFSASWCPPCRAEMPRIAKTYAETLKDDPDIELIHFSRDQNDEKALAWAKEHDVKFPVVKPRGGNPLDLHTRGIPHLFIVKADGTLIEEGHPMNIFNEEKFREIKGEGLTKNANPQTTNTGTNIIWSKAKKGMRTKSQVAKKYKNLQTSEVGGVKWLYVDAGKSVNLVGVDSSLPRNLVIPNEIAGKKVLTIDENAFKECEEIVSLETPDTVMSIDKSAFAGCPNLESVRILSGSVRWSVFRECPKLKSVFVGSKVQSLEYGSFAACERLSTVVFEEGSGRALKLQEPFGGDASLSSLHLPARYDGTVSWCLGAFADCSSLTELTIADGNPYCRAENGLVLSADGKTLLSVASGLSSIEIPASVETIPSRAISGCNQIRELVIPDSVKTISASSIGGCSRLETVTIGKGIESLSPKIGNSLFYRCPRLTTVRFLGNAPAFVDNLIYKSVSPALVTYVMRGTDGWNRNGGGLPELWPTNGVNGRKIAYWGEKVKPFEPEGPYGIHMMAEPGCEDGADYVLGKLTAVYLPSAVRYYGDPFAGKKPSRIYPIRVKRSDGGMGYYPGTGEWSISLAKDRDTYGCSLGYLASSVLTVCEDAKWASFVFYVNRFVEADAEGRNPVSELKRDIEKGLSKDGDDKNWQRAHAPMWAALEELREKHPNFILKYCTLKNKRFAEGKLPEKLSAHQMAELLGEVTGEDAVGIFVRYGLCGR